jgi:hypothetical protein
VLDAFNDLGQQMPSLATGPRVCEREPTLSEARAEALGGPTMLASAKQSSDRAGVAAAKIILSKLDQSASMSLAAQPCERP